MKTTLWLSFTTVLGVMIGLHCFNAPYLGGSVGLGSGLVLQLLVMSGCAEAFGAIFEVLGEILGAIFD